MSSVRQGGTDKERGKREAEGLLRLQPQQLWVLWHHTPLGQAAWHAVIGGRSCGPGLGGGGVGLWVGELAVVWGMEVSEWGTWIGGFSLGGAEWWPRVEGMVVEESGRLCGGLQARGQTCLLEGNNMWPFYRTQKRERYSPVRERKWVNVIGDLWQKKRVMETGEG